MTATTLPIARALNRRWVSLGYGVFVLALIGYEWVRTPGHRLTPVLAMLGVLLIAAPLTGLLLNPFERWERLYSLLLLLLDIALSFGVLGSSSGYHSQLWPVLLIPVTVASLVLPVYGGVTVALLLCLGYGTFFLAAPRSEFVILLSDWLMRSAAVGVVALIVQRMVATQERLQRRGERRERALSQFLAASNLLRAATHTHTVLEEVAGAVQAAGKFDCVTLSRIDWARGSMHMLVALGANKRRLANLEGSNVRWDAFSPFFDGERGVSTQARWVDSLPFRAGKREIHLLLPLMSQFGELRGLITVSLHTRRQSILREAQPLLELLANQASVALDNAALFSTLEQRVQAATAELARSTQELRVARDHAETQYHIARTLSMTLDEGQILEQALALVAQATNAERGGIVLPDANSKRLTFRSTLDRHRAGNAQGLERAQDLVTWVLTNRETAIVPDTAHDTRWHERDPHNARSFSALAVPLLLEHESRGVLLLIHSEPQHFTRDHAQLALAAAEQIAVALSKANLYRYVSEQSERLGRTAQQREEEASKSLAMLRSIGDGVIVGDRMGRVRLINPTAEHILGIKANTYIGRPLTELPGAIQDEGSEGARLYHLKLNERTVRAHLTPVLSSKSEWLGSVVVYQDITKQVMSDKLKSEFVATASHELRTPLTSIRGYVDMLLMGTCGPMSDAQRSFVKIIKNNVGRLVELIDELLDMSRAEAGEVRLRRELVDAGEMLLEVSQSLYGQFNERRVTLTLDVQDGLPLVSADRQRLRQIMVNLVGNACKYTSAGGQVALGLHNDDDHLRLDVRDTGVGIAADSRQHIFKPFYRADNPLRDEVGGTGLGLSITRKLVELHGGRIWFESKEGAGSTFSFTLPLPRALAELKVGERR